MAKQITIEKSALISGLGLHTGCSVSVRLEPGLPGEGIVFSREGCPFGECSVRALASNVTETVRRTVIGNDRISVSTVEHFMAAAYSSGIHSLRVFIDSIEMPVLDGCSKEWMRLFEEAGKKELDASVSVLELSKPVVVISGDAAAIAAPADVSSFTYVIDYPGTVIGSDACTFIPSKMSFAKEIAPARTFGFYKEIEYIKANNLAKGCDLSNALVIMDDGYSSDLRVPSEPARHKCLDLIGDAALCGFELKASVTAIRSGHSLNTRLAALLEKLGEFN